ncbi:hypothetical protein [Chitinophaga sp. CB10]|uniref:hypothetical protein n=1 Tax=Chitinophaga sp. CB10 TaxID=1891659 RepID=UPI0025B8FEE4|nr:hypothetical protein [Chitinophaga sp. CB10]
MMTIVTCVHAQEVKRIPPSSTGNIEFTNDYCKAVEPARQKAEKLTDQYLQDLDEYKKGRFCSTCKRSASQVERELHIPFDQHIEDGRQQGRKAEAATEEMFAKLYQDYQKEWSSAYRDYEKLVDACIGANLKIKQQQEAEDKATRAHFRERSEEMYVQYKALIDSASRYPGADKQKFNEEKSTFLLHYNSVQRILNSSTYGNVMSREKREEMANHLEDMETALTNMDVSYTNIRYRGSGSTNTAQKSKPAAKDTTRTTAVTSTYVESAESRALRERAAQQQRTNEMENTVAATAAGAVAGIGMAAIASGASDYEDEEYSFVLRGILGLGYQQIPVVTNYGGSGFKPKSENDATGPFCLLTGLDAKFFHDRFIGFNIQPFFTYGLLAFSSSTGNLMNYGANANVKLGNAFQVVLKGGYEIRTGKENYDAAEIGINGYTYSNYNYSLYKYGIGLRYKFVELSGLREMVSMGEYNEPVYAFNLAMEYAWLGFHARYAPNYPVAGEITYPDNFDPSKKQALFQLGMYWRISIVKGK